MPVVLLLFEGDGGLDAKYLLANSKSLLGSGGSFSLDLKYSTVGCESFLGLFVWTLVLLMLYH
jgi:hypothetical protein